jgi:cellobiose-specific phosphotransferase system component IIA
MRIRKKAIEGYRKAKKARRDTSQETLAKALEALALTKELHSQVMQEKATDVKVKEVE